MEILLKYMIASKGKCMQYGFRLYGLITEIDKQTQDK